MSIIEVENLRKRYGPKVAVDGISLSIAEGEIFGILGPNGAGKTTTVECVAGLRTPDEGTIRVAGKHPAKTKDLLGVQLQESELPERITVKEAVELFASFYPNPVDWTERLGLAEHRDVEFAKLSGGQKQRLNVALALVGNPKIAILDELTTGLDPQARRDTWSIVEDVRKSGVTILLVTHFMEEAERLCDRIAVVNAGRIVALDTPSGLVSRVDGEQRVRFRPSEPLNIGELSTIPEITHVEQNGGHLTVTGSGNLLHAVTSFLARKQIIAIELRVDQVSLDDAYVELTGGSRAQDR
jgi:ABC-2 type transport system ATP-binding protein